MKPSPVQTLRRLVMAGCVCVISFASDASPQTSGESLRLQRLAEVAALWNEVKYFHPYIGTRPVDWDQALVQTLPRINAAKNTDDYRAAIDGLLAALHDPSTRTLDRAKAIAPPNANNDALPMVRMNAGVLHVDIAPDILVQPTRAGLAAGKDEVLQAAIELLSRP